MLERDDLRQTFRHARAIGIGLVGVLVFLYLLSGVYVVKPDQSGVVLRFGKVVAEKVPPGIHYHWPWPVSEVLRPRTTEIRALELPFIYSDAADGGHGELLTGDENLVRAVVLLQYTLSSPRQYLTQTADPDQVLERLARWQTVGYLASQPVDHALTTGREALQQYLKRSTQQLADTYGLGIRLTSVQLRSIEPPISAGVSDAFKAVASAREEKQKLVEQAEGERNRRLPKARADARRLIRDAEAYQREVTERAHGDGERFIATWEAYRHARSVTAQRLYLETIETILPRVRLLIANPDAESGAPSAALPALPDPTLPALPLP